MAVEKPKKGKSRPLYQQTADRIADILANTEPGTYLPSEPTLARQLGVSRATLREAMRTFEEQGLIVRRQGVGTYVTESPTVIDTGLEELYSIETLATKIGLEVEMGALEIFERRPTPEEIELLDIRPGDQVLEVARLILAGNRPVAYLIDVVPSGLLPDAALKEGFRGSVLDSLLRQAEPSLGHSRTEITAESAPGPIAKRFAIQRGDVLLRLDARLYSREGKIVDLSRSYFLPGTFRFHVVRRVGRTGS